MGIQNLNTNNIYKQTKTVQGVDTHEHNLFNANNISLNNYTLYCDLRNML